MDRGGDKISQSLDVVNILRTQQFILQLRRLLLTPKQRILNNFGRQNYLGSSDSSDKESDVDKNNIISKLEGYELDSKLDKIIVSNIFPKEDLNAVQTETNETVQ
jgi:hypothetical protein